MIISGDAEIAFDEIQHQFIDLKNSGQTRNRRGHLELEEVYLQKFLQLTLRLTVKN